MRRACSSKARGSVAILLGLAVTLLASRASAECACLWEGSFADVQASTDLVIAAEVVRIKGNAVDVSIEETLRGPDYLDEVRIWMATRDYCRPPAEDFAVGTRWVFALERIREVPPDGFDSRTPNFSYGRVDDYILSHCGGYWLNYSGEAVTGSLVDAPRWARDPDMTPVHMDLLRAFVAGKASADALREAAKEDPAVTELMLNTRAFLRGDPEVDEP